MAVDHKLKSRTRVDVVRIALHTWVRLPPSPQKQKDHLLRVVFLFLVLDGERNLRCVRAELKVGAMRRKLAVPRDQAWNPRRIDGCAER